MKKFLLFTIIAYLITSCCINDDYILPDNDNKNAQNKETVSETITGTQGKTLYLVKMNPTSKIVSANNSGYVYSNEIPDIYENQIYKNTSDFTVNDNSRFLNFYSKNISRSFRAIDTTQYEIGDTRDFWIMANDAMKPENIAWQQLNVVLRTKGEHCYIWVANDHWINGENSVNPLIVTNLKEKFDSVYPRITNVFGFPDNDKNRIHILIFDIPDPQNGQVFGYFMPKDYGPYEETLRSNECCMFYLDAFLTRKLPNMAYSTLAHEFQHMINYYNKTLFGDKTESTQTWFTEMMSMLCEDMLQTFLGINDNDSPISRMEYFNSGYYRNGINEWQNSQYSYACVYAFGAYLVRNFGGIRLLEAIAKNRQTNKNAIENGLKELGYNETFDSVFLKFSQALIYEDSVNLTFNKEVKEILNGFEYTFKAFNIWKKANGNFPILYGPVCFSPAKKYELRPYGFTIHTQNSWQNITTDTFTVELIKNDNNDIKYMFILK